ncbi:S-layer homology domain-containing protein [Salimicrobium humidisoli]|uniref:S-layer protein n=1 Tax=Salimicrobium humidisoli TaxID=2029857 RepID=A0ABX4HT82_9BACI|nr:S-layer homology domain-containing protein [Salimicrobium humidisoli]PBB06442.1 S-layer protein [Salimicrobium humidisoli]
MKRISVFLATLLILLSISAPALHAQDDISGSPFEEDMRSLIDKEIMQGFEDGTYRPKAEVTRAQFTAFITRALDLPVTEEVITELQSLDPTSFSDVDSGRWYYPYILVANNEGLIQGYPGGTFKPNEKISRQNMAVIMMNAAKSKGIVTETEPLTFKDNGKIRSYAKEAVQILTGLEIINGKVINGGSYFAPSDLTTRGETAAVINRLLKVLDPPEEKYNYSVATLGKDKDPLIHKSYKTYDQAVSNASSGQVVLKGNSIAWIEDGKAVSNTFTSIYKDKNLSSSLTYFTSGVEVKLLDLTEDYAKVQLADTVGYVAQEDINLIPSSMIEGRSYYYAKNGDLYHYKYNTSLKSGSSYVYGKAPSFMQEGRKYYSYNGNTFLNENGSKAGDAYQYFNRLPLYSDTSYTAEQLDNFIAAEQPNSPLIGTGDDFKKAEKLHGTNALYLMAHAIHESNWGKSRIAQDKNNLFGIGARDGTPYESAYSYKNFETGILEAAEDFIVPGYFENTWKSYGAHLGNKSSGINVYYASDPYWGQKIAGHMYRADKYLSKKYGVKSELGASPLAETLKPDTNVRTSARTSAGKIYSLGKAGSTVQVLDTVNTSSEGTWYEVTTKDYESGKTGVKPVDHGKGFVYSHNGRYGTNLEKLNIAE